MIGERDRSQELSPIVMTDRDWGRLKRLVEKAATLYHPVSELLEKEIRRAAVCPAKDIPPDVVTMNSRVVFQTQSGAEWQSRVLVFPECYTPNGFCVSITSPLGAALIGLHAGCSFHYWRRDGEPVHVSVREVAFQPEAAARERASRRERTPVVGQRLPGPAPW